MCGIAGIINLNGKKCRAEDMRRMCDMLVHRGPDDQGYYVSGNVSLGHRRLSIIDLSPAGHQPMLSKDGNIVIIYNGEIYNFKELREVLKKRGYKFLSGTDTEVILYSYQEWGIDCVGRLNGMFAFAIFNKKERTLILARDKYGIKPLYYWNTGKVFIFASEIKAFLPNPEFRVGLDLEVLFEYFTFQNTFTNKTLFKGVKLLPAATILQITTDNGGQTIIRKYWDFNFSEDTRAKSDIEYVEEFQRIFKKAVKRQLSSDVEVGSYLSGGIDSSSIVAITSKHLKELKTFCIGFDLSSASGLELSFDEREKAEHIAYLYQTEHYEMVLKSGDMRKCLPRLVWSLEDLRLGQSYPNFYASKLASKFVKVCLSGAGGDELFAGYPWRYYRNIHSKSFDDYVSGYYEYWQRLIPNETLKQLFSPVKNEIKNVSTEDIFRNVFADKIAAPRTPEDYINQSLYFESKTFLHGLFIVEDKLSMANSLEVRVPFLDDDLVNFALRVPVKLKLKNIDKILKIDEDELAKREKYFQKMRDGKIILRKALGKYFADKIVNQHKQGFSGPDASWFKGESIDYVKSLLLDKNAGINNCFDYSVVRSLINEHLEGKNNRRLFIWSLLCFELWLKIFINKDYESLSIQS